MLATILEPTDGTAVVCGHDIVEQPEKVRANVGFLSTATALYRRLTAQEFVEYFGRLNGLDEATLKKRVDAIFIRLDMNGFRDRRCDKLSTGMQQKTSIARTLVHDPPVMIFDEPTGGLDVMTARTITAFIRNAVTVAKPSSSPATSCPKSKSSATPSVSSSLASSLSKVHSRNSAINMPSMTRGNLR